MKNRTNRIIRILTVIIIATTALILMLTSVKPLCFEEYYGKVTKVGFQWNKEDQISGLINYVFYRDIEVENLKDLEKASELIAKVRVKSVEQVNDFCLVNVELIAAIKGEPEKEFTILHLNNLEANGYDKKRKGFSVARNKETTLEMEMSVNMEKGREYLVFLNRMKNQDIYNASTILYSIIPLKEEIRIVIVDFGKHPGLIRIRTDEFDYLARENEISSVDRTDKTEREIWEKAGNLSEKYIEIYESIIKAVNADPLYDADIGFVETEY
ncbi:MAG: hypothetical protein IJM15_03850 [Erysipelotrichaceae bacterium]|nr:hypothetical protein [Erysipelotrichaceae bacterium]